MNESFSEYVLYEPILRILTARAYSVQCEYECPGLEKNAAGDKKRIDFVATKSNVKFALEVKWVRRRRLSLAGDIAKLCAFRNHFAASSAFLCVFGRGSHAENLPYLDGRFVERGEAVFAEFRSTRYGCRIFELATNEA